MIALESNLPLLRVGRFDLPAVEPAWIEAGIREAAREAGHPEWWFACDITRSLVLYLKNRFAGTVITLEDINRRVRNLLEKIGFKDIGARVNFPPPDLRVSIRDLAVEADGFELRFFQLLGDRLSELCHLGARRITFSHTREGVKTLRSARNWSAKCDQLEQEILEFLRRRLDSASECAVALNSFE